MSVLLKIASGVLITRRRDREWYRVWGQVPAHGKYRLRMAVDPQVRKAKFGHFIEKALEDARGRGLTARKIQEITGVSTTTFYRWRNGEWTTAPRAGEVKAFCEGLGIDVNRAYRILGWTDEIQGREPEPEIELDRDWREVLRRLNDPNTPDVEKYLIQETIRSLANRPKPSTGAASS